MRELLIGAGELIAERGELVLQQFVLLARLGQQRFQLLVVLVERTGLGL